MQQSKKVLIVDDVGAFGCSPTQLSIASARI